VPLLLSPLFPNYSFLLNHFVSGDDRHLFVQGNGLWFLSPFSSPEQLFFVKALTPRYYIPNYIFDYGTDLMTSGFYNLHGNNYMEEVVDARGSSRNGARESSGSLQKERPGFISRYSVK
jgi:hypothetical protein